MIRFLSIFRSFSAFLLIVTIMLTAVSCRSHKPEKGSDKDKEQTVMADVKKNDKKGNRKVVEEARTWLGTPYGYAMAEKGVGTDCSGMVMLVYQESANCKLPRNSARQAEFCNRIESEDVMPGDLVFFATGKDPERISHVGIMLDDVNFIHASTKKGVVISKVNTPYYMRTFKMFGRVPRGKSAD